jgi:HEAT repeat protein
MTKRKLLLAAVIIVLGTAAGLLLIPDTRQYIFALYRGEHFFAGKPTSSWREAVVAEVALPAGSLQPACAEWLHGDIDAVRVLIDLLKDEDAGVRRTAAHLLTVQWGKPPGPEAADAIAPLTRMLEEPDKRARYYAAWALSCIGPAAAPATSALVPLLEDKEERVAWQATSALGNIGPPAKEALPALRAACKDSRKRIRVGAEAAVKSIEGDDKARP